MKSFLRNILSVLAVVLVATHVGHARPVFSAPEMDPAMGTAALVLLGGAIMVIRGRRKA